MMAPETISARLGAPRTGAEPGTSIGLARRRHPGGDDESWRLEGDPQGSAGRRVRRFASTVSPRPGRVRVSPLDQTSRKRLTMPRRRGTDRWPGLRRGASRSRSNLRWVNQRCFLGSMAHRFEEDSGHIGVLSASERRARLAGTVLDHILMAGLMLALCLPPAVAVENDSARSARWSSSSSPAASTESGEQRLRPPARRTYPLFRAGDAAPDSEASSERPRAGTSSVDGSAAALVAPASTTAESAGSAGGGTVSLDDVARFFEASCTRCHSGAHAKLGLLLDRDSFYRSTVNVPARSSRRIKLVSPGDPEHSMLYLRLLPPSVGGYRGPQMPMGKHLSSQEIVIIRSWIEQFPKEPWGPPERTGLASSQHPPAPVGEPISHSTAVADSAAQATSPHPEGATSSESRSTTASEPGLLERPAAPLFFDTFSAQLPTSDTLGRKMLEFRFTHRFKTSTKEAGADNLYGLDAGAWISLGLAYGVTDWLDVGVRRTNDLQDYEAYMKASLLRQKGRSPLAVSFYESFVRLDGPDLANRNRWTAQLVLARRIAEWLSVTLVPSYVSTPDFLDEDVKRGTTAVGAAAEVRLKSYIAVTGEYIAQIGGVKAPYRSGTVGLQLRTANHAFHLLFTNARGTHTDVYLPGGDLDWRHHEFRLGFNISRTFDLGH